MIPRAGDRVGPFLLLSELGKGGSAPVWLAHETYGNTVLRPAAVKLFRVDAATGNEGDAEARDAERRRIATEGRLLSAVEHPGIVRFYALVEDEKRGLVGLAMEVAQGTSLEERLVTDDALLDIAEVARIGEAVASALAAVHRAGLVHRDVKPANIVESGGAYKLVDFGLAGLTSNAGTPPVPLPETVPRGTKVSSLTLNGSSTNGAAQVAGTVGYVDPAMLGEGLSPGPASDLYGLGATLYELLTGRLPAATEGGLSGQILAGRAPAPPVATLREGVLPAFAELVDRLVLPSRRDRPTSAERVTSELGRIRRALLGAARALPPEDTGPFRGLLRFEASDRDVYFGRTAEVASTLELLRTRGFVTLVGPSGSGKSSLARAGIVPAIREGALGWPARWNALTVAPGRDPWTTVGEALRTWLGIDESGGTLGPPDLVAHLAERVDREGRGLLLVIDQLEELAMLVGREHAESRARTVELLSLLAERIIPGVRVLGTVRGDLLEVLLGTSGLARAVFRGSVPVSPLSELAWEEVSEEALSVYGYRFEDAALAAEITTELRTYASAMPLVQFALSQLWARRDRARKLITRDAWIALGGIRGALDRHGDATLAELVRVRPGAEREVREVLLALTTLQGTRATRTREELARTGDHDVVIAALVRARLLVEEGERLTLAHEALLGEWGKLRAFLAEARRERWLASDVEQAAERLRIEPDTATLLEGPRLAAALAVVSGGHVSLSPEALRLVSESQLAVRRARRKNLLIYATVSVTGLLLLTFAAFALVAARARERALGDRIEQLERRLQASPTSRP